jgi:hypothetical protein
MSDAERITEHPGPGVPPGLGPPVEGPTTSGVAHERRDANVPALFAIGGGLLAVGVIIHLAVWGVFRLLEDRAEQRRVSFPLAAAQNARPLEARIDGVPKPILEGLYQRDKPSDRPDVRPADLRPDRLRGGYGWVEGQQGRVAQIPIDVAMREVLHGKEFRASGPAGKGDRRRPAQPNSGRGAAKEGP